MPFWKELKNTLRERFELSRFLTVAGKDIVENWSLDRKPEGPKTVFLEPERTLRLWTESYQFAISSRKSLKSGNVIYIPSSTFQGTLNKDTIHEVERKNANLSWQNLDDYSKCRQSIRNMVIRKNEIECDCKFISWRQIFASIVSEWKYG